MGRKFWWLKAEADGVYLYLTDSPQDDGTKLAYRQANKEKQHRVFTSVVKIVPCNYSDRDQDIKIYFKSKTDNPKAMRKCDFLWNKDGPFNNIKGSALTTNDFATRINGILNNEIMKLSTIQEDGDQSDTSQNMDSYEFTDQSSEIINSSTETPSTSSSLPDSSKKRKSTEVEGVPLLHKKRYQGESERKEEQMTNLVRQAYLGTAKITINHLELGPLIRDVNSTFVENLKGRMIEFPNHCYQPLCVLTSDVQSKEDFKDNAVSGYHYRVIGGCHNFLAATSIHEQHPEMELFKTRLCVIYHQSLSEEAVFWLANKHNEIGALRHGMTVKEKIQMCHNLKRNYGESDDRWKEACALILNETHRTVNLYCSLASLQADCYKRLMELFHLYESGSLKKQKLKKKEVAGPPDVKVYIFRDIINLPPASTLTLLEEICEKKIGLSELKEEAKKLSKLRKIQIKFLEIMDLDSWETATQKYPHETTRETLSQFLGMSLNGNLEELRTFCRRLRSSSATAEHSLYPNHVASHFVNSNVEDITLRLIKSIVPDFRGFDFTVLDMPEKWPTEKLRQFSLVLTALNLDVNMTKFKLAVLCDVSQLDAVTNTLSSVKDFRQLWRVYYHVPDIHQVQPKEKDGLLKSVFGMVIASTQGEAVFKWNNGQSVNLLCMKLGDLFREEDGGVIDNRQKPVDLYKELILSFTKPREWVLDACCGIGTGVIASAEVGRNAIGVDCSDQMVRMANLRFATMGNGNKQDAEDGSNDEVWDDVEEDLLAAAEKVESGNLDGTS